MIFHKNSASLKVDPAASNDPPVGSSHGASDADIPLNNNQDVNVLGLLVNSSGSEPGENHVDKKVDDTKDLSLGNDQVQDQVLNIISVNSSAQDSPQGDEKTASYSSFHDPGGPLQNPTSYILQTYSDGDHHSSSDDDGDVVGGASSMYSSQKTVPVSQDSVVISTPEAYVKTYDLRSAPVLRPRSSSTSSRHHFRSRSRITARYASLNGFSVTNRDLNRSDAIYNVSHNGDGDVDCWNQEFFPPERPKLSSSRLFQPIPRLRSQGNASNSERPIELNEITEDDKKFSIVQSPTGINTEPQTLRHFDSAPPVIATGGVCTANIDDWGSALPAVMYSNTIHEPKIDTANENDIPTRQMVQASLLEGPSITGESEKEYMDVIKRNLSRNKSLKSKKFAENKKDSPPLLFSQDKKALSRSLSEVRGDNNEDPASQFPKQNSKTKNREETISDQNESNCQPELYLSYAASTAELNSLDTDNEVIDYKFINSAKEPPLMFKSQGEKEDYSKLDRFLGKTGAGGGDDSDDMNAKTRKSSTEKKYSITTWILILALLSFICVFVPLVIVYSRGNEENAERYLNNISPQERNIFLNKFDWFNLQSSAAPKGKLGNGNNANNKNISSDDALQVNHGTSIAGISLFENIPIKYQKNEEIQEAMNNSALNNVFYGIDYAPRNVIYPICGVSMHDVMLDVALLSQVTSRIRTYGTQCNQAKFILDSIRTLNLNVSLSMGVWIGPNDDINEFQIQEMKSLLKFYPRNLFESIFIGNEVLFRNEQTPKKLVEYIKKAKDFVQEELKWDLPVGTSELASKVNAEVLKASDILGSNTHPFFAGTNVQLSTKWIYDFIKYQLEPIKEQIGNLNSPDIVISEVGWPYQGGKFKKAIAGKRHMQYFLNNWVCQANKRQYPWYYFEAFDEPWKQVYHTDNSKYETEWGLFTADRKLKRDIIFPIC